MLLKVTKVVGLNTDQKAAQAYSLNHDPEHLFIGVLTLNCDDAFTRGRQLLSEASDAFFDPSSFNIDDNLPDGERLTKVFNLAKSKLNEGEEMDLVLGVVSKKVLYLIAEGEVDVILKRGQNLTSLVNINNPTGLVSGFLQEGDKVFFTTKSLAAFLDSELNTDLDKDLQFWEEEVASKLAVEGTDDDGLAGLVLSVENEEQISIPKSPQEDIVEESVVQDSAIKNPIGNILKIFSKIPFLNRKDSIEVGDVGGRGIRRMIPTSGRVRLILAVILLVIIAGGVSLQYKTSKDKQRDLQFNQFLSQSRDDLTAAQNLQSLNPADAKSKLDQAKDEVNKALTLKPGDQQAIELKKNIEITTIALTEGSKASFDTFLDLDLIKKGFKADKFTVSGNNLLLLDPDSKTLVTVDLSKKSNQTLAGKDQLGESKLASINGGFSFVYSEDKGVLRVDNTNKKVTVVAKTDKDFGKISDITGFGSNIYLLDSTKNQIWKYVPTSAGYSDKQEYLSKGTKADFAGVLRMQIESSVYILKSGGEIVRFTKGGTDNFSLGGLDKGIKDPKSIFTSSDVDNLYILDSGNARVVVVTKTGSYKAQYKGDKFAAASDLVVDEKAKKIYLLDGGKIYSTDLK